MAAIAGRVASSKLDEILFGSFMPRKWRYRLPGLPVDEFLL
jgi:hypothetical protein